MKALGVLAVIAGACASLYAVAQESAEEGAAKAAVCQACHGPSNVNPEWPNLAGQGERYLIEQTKAFRDGKRNNPVMAPMASGLSDEDIADIAAHFAAQTPSGLEADPSYWKAGEKLYRGGDGARSIPACIACHGPVGRGNSPAAYPALRAQHAQYTQKQLHDYASGARMGANAEVMQTIAKRMSQEDIRNVASYVQGMR
ncbi:MAG TPA: c-type cytochrome [Steroidobacteraceae bacterium]|nr:c-type cytochrome [Steroidobacteraceae bacterium]